MLERGKSPSYPFPPTFPMFRLTSSIHFWGWKEGEQLWTNWVGKLLTLHGVGLLDVCAGAARLGDFPECIEEHRRTLWGFESIGLRKSKPAFLQPLLSQVCLLNQLHPVSQKSSGGDLFGRANLQNFLITAMAILFLKLQWRMKDSFKI